MKKISNLLLIATIVILPLITGIFSIVRKPELILQMEARKTANFSGLLEDKNINNIDIKFEKALSDQLIFREKFIEVSAISELILGKRLINNVLINTKEDFLVTIPDELSTAYIETNKKDLNKINQYFNNTTTPFVYIELPRKYNAYADFIPEYYYDKKAPRYNITEIIGKNNYLDLTNILSENARGNYYRTDHHMNDNGINLVYKNVVNYINKEHFNIGSYRSEDKFLIDTYKRVFIGSDGRKTTRYSISAPDTIKIYKPMSNFNVSAKLYSSNQPTELFQTNRIKKNDIYNNDYSVYLGGDENVCIYNKNSISDKKLLLMGNSYDNALIPFLAIHFKQICHLDYRKIEKKADGDIDLSKFDLVISMQDYEIIYRKDAFTFLKQLTDL